MSEFKLDNTVAVRPNKTVYRDGNYGIKVFNEGFLKSDILNEALNHARVEETGLSVPKLIAVAQIDGKWAIVSEFIEGKTLAKLIEENPADESLIDRFVNIQLEIHSKSAPMLNHLLDKMNRKISESSLSDAAKYDLHTRLESLPKHRKLCHGDFNPSNIIITPDDKYYVIDWAHATQGNASADAARTYLLFCLHGDKKTGDRYLQLFCQKSNTAPHYVQNWLPIVAASQSVKGKPEEREFLLRWAEVVDYQ
ncbi:MAG: phosphotransferase [Clostridiales bacterium]|jgi:aminoglycoside phosphotransferase (APT) family kinase protein|nr:phosphotransferase [Clostridiales bacterium]